LKKKEYDCVFEGIRYRKDYLKYGIASDYGRSLSISRVPIEDMILYQTERYDLNKFSYEIDLTDDGDYVLWMKFAEVWFNGPNMKVCISMKHSSEELFFRFFKFFSMMNML
jgi:hypothetical protein